MPRKVFVAGEILTAADVNANLMDQAVMRFADSTARGSAIPSPTEGMTSYLDDLNRIEVYSGSAWGAVSRILQVVSTTKTDTFSTSTAGFNAVTGLSATISPTSTTSKVFVLVQINVAHSSISNAVGHIRVTGGNAGTYVGDASGSKTQAASQFGFGGSSNNFSAFPPLVASFVDSPATVSATTYQVELFRNAGTVYVNRVDDESTDTSFFARGASSITVMEVAG